MSILRDVLIVAVMLATAAAAIFALWLHHMVNTHGALVLIGRWHVGFPLHGKLAKDRGQWTRREKIRAGFRVGSELVVVLLLIGLVVVPTITLIVLGLIAAGGLMLGAVWVIDKVVNFPHNRNYVAPLERTVHELIGHMPVVAIEPVPGTEQVQSVTLEWDHDVEIGPPEQAMVLDAVTRRLSIEAPAEDWDVKGRRREVTFTRTEPPPGMVYAHEIAEAARQAGDAKFVLGKGKKAENIVIDINTDTPHVGMSMGSNDGKSTAAMNMGCQHLYHGGILAVLDDKLISHMWCRGLPNVAYAGTGEEIFALLVWLAWDDENHVSELTRRKNIVLASADIHGNVHADIGPRILVAAEELNSLQKTLKRYWRQIGGKGPNPAAEALEIIHFAGRQLGIHVIDIGQRLSAKATSGSGSGDSRENIGAILFSNPTASTWKMLAEGHPQPPASDHKGRYQLYTRKTVREFQGVLWDVNAAREFAMSGTIAVPRDDMPGTGGMSPAGAVVLGVPGQRAIETQAPDQPFVLGHGPVVPAIPGAVTLREASDAGLFPSVAAARKAVQRAALEPVGQRKTADLFDLIELRTCQKGRTRG